MSTDTKSGEAVSALVTAAISAAVLVHGQGSLLSVDMMQEWCYLAAITSVAYILSLIFRVEWLRSMARFYSGLAWGAIILVGLWRTELQPLMLCAAALFGFDFYAVFKGEKWHKSNCPASVAG